MKNILSIIFVICIVLTIASCEKSADYPKRLMRSEFISGDLKMFTKEGEVTDQQLINDFIKRYRNILSSNYPNSTQKVYSFEDDIDQYDHYNYEFIFHSATNGQIVTIMDDKESYEFDLITKNGYINLSINDTITSLVSNTGNSIYKCLPEIISEVLLSRTTGYDAVQQYLRPLFAKKIANEIHLVLVSYLETKHYNDELKSIHLKGAINNMINLDYVTNYKKLNSNWRDTLVYKESYIIFKE